jgi:hypothetical protein
LCWGGSIYQEKIIFRESIDSFAPLLEIFKFNDIDISFNNFGVELFSPTVFKKIKEQVDLEIKKRPLETTVVYQDRGKIMFTKRKIHTRHNN